MAFALAAHAPDDKLDPNRLARRVTWVLIAIAAGLAVARIWTCHSPDPRRPVPFMSANDRSRWCTVRSLVDFGTFAIDPVISSDDGAWWDTIDKVRHAGSDGKMHYYSSKPVLWPAMLAGQYWLIQRITGWTLDHDLFLVVRIILTINNVLALALLIWCVARATEQITDNLASRMFVVATAACGTLLTTFSVTLNNHLPAAALVAWSMYLLFRVMRGDASGLVYALLGAVAGLAATMEFPAAGWLAISAVIAVSTSLRRTLLGFIPGAAVVAASFWGANFLAHGEWRPAYAHRSDGAVVARAKGDFKETLDGGLLPDELRQALAEYSRPLAARLHMASVTPRTGGVRQSNDPQWVVDEGQADQLIIVQVGSGDDPSGDSFQVRLWDNWYDYPGSYWRSDNSRKSIVDHGEPNPWKYLWHMTIGHHGVLSLSPVFLLSAIGVFQLCATKRYRVQFLSFASLALTIVVFAFYVTRPEMDRNYGGMTSGLRWVFWLYPIWFLWMIPALEFASRHRVFWFLSVLLLAVSVASAQYSAENPWVHPWLYQLLSR